jgi:hypothetical protein
VISGDEPAERRNVGTSLATLPVEETEILVETESGADISDGVLSLPGHAGTVLH